jgi:hypothetical protein
MTDFSPTAQEVLATGFGPKIFQDTGFGPEI